MVALGFSGAKAQSAAGVTGNIPGLMRTDEGGIALHASRCEQCGAVAFPAVDVCCGCMSGSVRPVGLSASGSLYAFSEVHVGPRRWKKPYVLGYVDLPEGVRVLTRIVGGAPRIGAIATLDTAVVGSDEQDRPILSYVFRLDGDA